MNLKSRKIISIALVFFMMLTILPLAPVTAHAAGTESSPVYVTNFAELKAELEKNEDSYIVVNSFTNTTGLDYYNLNEDYENDGDFAIRVAYDRTKTLVVNTTIDCRSTASDKVLSSFIYNPSNLTIMGNGTINIGFCLNTREVATKNSVIHNAGTLTVKGNVTLTTENTMQYSNGHAIHNDGTATIEGGTFVGFCNMLDSYGDNQVDDTAAAVINSTDGIMTIKDGIFRASTLRTGEAAHGLYSVNTGISISGGVFNGIESNTTMVAEATDEPISSFLASGYEYRKVTDDTVFDGSAVSETGESLYVAPTGSMKHSITVSGGSASHAKAFAGTTVTLTAEASDGMVFDKWEVISGGVTIEDNKFEMPNADVEIKAVYKEKSVTITGTAYPAEGGTVTGSGEYTISQQVILTATANTGYKFVRWEENGIEVHDLPEYSFDVTSSTTDRNLVAVFEVDSTVSQPTKIDLVNVTVTEPEAGKTPAVPVVETENVILVTSTWKEEGKTEKATTFEAGKTYVLEVLVNPEIDYDFATNPAVKINGKDATVTHSSPTAIMCSYKFAVPEVKEDIDEIAVTVTEPEAGKTPAVPVVETENVMLVTSTWKEEGKTEKATTFEAGKTYVLEVLVNPEIDYDFATNPAVKINGKDATVTHSSPTAIMCSYKFAVPEEGGETPPTEYDITVTGGTASANKAVAGTVITLTVDESAIPAGKVFDNWEVVSGDVTIEGNKFVMPENAVVVKATYKAAEHEHTYGELIAAQAEVHTQAELKAAVAAHYFCDVCDTYFTEEKVETTLAALTGETPAHSYGAWVNTDTAKHWKECSCGLKAEEAEHIYDNSKDATCDVCNYTRTVSSGSSSGGGFSGSYNYPVIVGDTDGADVAVSDEHATKGEKITITVKPDAGKQVDEVIVTDADGDEIAVTKTGDNEYTFTMPASKVTVDVATEAADYGLRIVMQINNRNILVNGKTMVNDVAPVIVADRTLVPIRVVTELLGGSAHWDNATRTVTLKIDGKTMNMTIGKEIPGFGTSAVIMNDRTYVPVRYVMEKLGADVEWINATRQIIIEK